MAGLHLWPLVLLLALGINSGLAFKLYDLFETPKTLKARSTERNNVAMTQSHVCLMEHCKNLQGMVYSACRLQCLLEEVRGTASPQRRQNDIDLSCVEAHCSDLHDHDYHSCIYVNCVPKHHRTRYLKALADPRSTRYQTNHIRENHDGFFPLTKMPKRSYYDPSAYCAQTVCAGSDNYHQCVSEYCGNVSGRR